MAVTPAPPAVRAADSDLQLIRALAASSIIFCHILEIYGYPAAWWANFGVQVFLFLSGSLFGPRTIRVWPEWFTRRALRILPAYLLLITTVFAANCLFMKPSLLWKPYLASLFCIQDFCKITLPGCDHLWYLTLLLVCYLTVPLLQALRDRFRGPRAGAAVFFLGLPVFYYLAYKIFPFLTYPYVASVAAFAWGYWIGAHRARLLAGGSLRRALPWIAAVALALIAARGALEAWALTQTPPWGTLYGKLVPWSKAFLAAFLFLSLYGGRWALGQTRLVRWIADNSYEIYLTHHIFIFGSLSVMAFFHSRALDIVAMLAATAIATVVLRRAASPLAEALGWLLRRPVPAPAIQPAPYSDRA